jgi:hypothetical protein
MSSRRTLNYVALAGVAALSLFSAALFELPMATTVHAQTASGPQFMVTWSASNSYIPSFYKGKALPSYGSKITAELEILSPGGKFINLGSQPIYWYEDGTVVGGGVGVQKVTFSPFGTPPASLDLTISLPQYPGGALVDKIEIPFVQPMAVIEAPYPSQQFSSNPLAVTAIPFFFDAVSPSDLSYTWAVNGQTGTSAENPETANITLPQGTPSGSTIDVSLVIKNSTPAIAASADQTLTYQSQL